MMRLAGFFRLGIYEMIRVCCCDPSRIFAAGIVATSSRPGVPLA